MTTIKVLDSNGIVLDWLVWKCEEHPKVNKTNNPLLFKWGTGDFPNYSTNWSIAGPIIEREGIDIQQVFCYMEGSFAESCGWQALRHTKGGPINPPRQVADTPLIAAMRCYVASKMGDVVEVPDELL